MPTVMIVVIISVLVVLAVLVLSVLTINKGYSYKHTVDPLKGPDAEERNEFK